jgi:hypothetical protein
MKCMHLIAVAAIALPGCADLPTTSSGGGVALEQQASIEFANQRSSVTSWQADGRDGLWIESGKGDWYYGKFISPCFGLDHAIAVGFDNGSSNRIDRFSSVVVPYEPDRCQLASFTKSEPPPKGERHVFGK